MPDVILGSWQYIRKQDVQKRLPLWSLVSFYLGACCWWSWASLGLASLFRWIIHMHCCLVEYFPCARLCGRRFPFLLIREAFEGVGFPVYRWETSGLKWRRKWEAWRRGDPGGLLQSPWADRRLRWLPVPLSHLLSWGHVLSLVLCPFSSISVPRSCQWGWNDFISCPKSLPLLALERLLVNIFCSESY